MFAHGETVTIQSAGPRFDKYADENVYDDWKNPTEVDVANVLVGDGGSTEPSEAARAAVDSDFDLIFQPPVTVTPSAQDRVLVRGLACDVAGRPFLWQWAASGGEAGMVVRVKIREG